MINSPIKLVAGTHAWFARENAPLSQAAYAHKPQGVTTGFVVVDKNCKPYRSDSAWKKLGIIDTARVRAGNVAPIVVHDSGPGHLVVADVIALGQERVFSIHCKEVQQLTVQLLFATAGLAEESTQFNPDEGLGAVKGWLKFQIYDNRDALKLTIDQWASVSIAEDIEFGNKALTEVTYDFACIAAALNTGA